MDFVHIGGAAGNIVTSCALAVAGFAALAMAIAPIRTARALPAWLTFGAGAALIALAADEGLELHDRVGRWLWREHGAEAPGPIGHVDDLIVIGYLVAGVAAVAVTLPLLLRTPRFLAGIAAAAVLLATGEGIDALGTAGSWTEAPEEAFEAVGAVTLAVVFLLQARSQGVSLARLPVLAAPPAATLENVAALPSQPADAYTPGTTCELQ